MVFNVTLFKIASGRMYRIPLTGEIENGNSAFGFVKESEVMKLKPNSDLDIIKTKYEQRGTPACAALEVDGNNHWTIINLGGVQVFVRGDLLQKDRRTHITLASPNSIQTLVESGDEVQVDDFKFKLVDGEIPNDINPS